MNKNKQKNFIHQPTTVILSETKDPRFCLAPIMEESSFFQNKKPFSGGDGVDVPVIFNFASVSSTGAGPGSTRAPETGALARRRD